MLEGPMGEDMRDLLLELCLTLPGRLSSLLPYLPHLMNPLVLCLKGSDDLVILASWSHLRPAPYPWGGKASQLLGKLGNLTDEGYTPRRLSSLLVSTVDASWCKSETSDKKIISANASIPTAGLGDENMVHAKAALDALNVFSEMLMFLAHSKHADIARL
ncbi:hypothetical protein Q3G72_004202 [Acer saccharum]|nr:hypothetical protein Q3G72_004202 [Acer saccharum]